MCISKGMKELKKKFKKQVHKNPEKYFATKILKKRNFNRQQCTKCKTFFYSKKERQVCGDPNCIGKFEFLEEKQFTTVNYDYVTCWKKLSTFFEKRNYTSIKRYPVVARWRDDTDFVQASIYNFQPFVVSGEVNPPANPLVVPQFCLRFNDVDNVGVTMSHNTGFVMVGQHAFNSKKEWDQDKYFEDLLDYFLNVLKIDANDLVLHEDAWAGGGNYGPCMEFFCGGLELANQVYMMFDVDTGELDIKVLDMGLGLERIAWFVQGKKTLYDAAFPKVMKYLLSQTTIDFDEEFIQKYLPYGSNLNSDEVEDLQAAWKNVANQLGCDVDTLKNKILPMRTLYSLAEHSRTLLISISDGALPSNVKGGYNLRVLLRRCVDFIDDNDFGFEIFDICKVHAKELKDFYPELQDNLDHVKKIIDVETKKYRRSKKQNIKKIKKAVTKNNLDVKTLTTLYKSHGINPETVKNEAKKHGKTVHIPDNFYSLISEKDDARTSKKEKKIVDSTLPPTKPLYFEHYDLIDFKARVLHVFDREDYDIVVLDESAFYPKGGGQEYDKGHIGKARVFKVLKQGKTTLHFVVNRDFEVGDVVIGKVDFDRRLQLSQHHTATHIMTGSCREVFGDHIWQAGAKKTVEKARLDITHYEALTSEDEQAIENKVNEIINANATVYSQFMKRDVAEARYGTRIYQGGVVPGNLLRIVEIPDFDVEACGGTHVNVTGDVKRIKILKTTKLQDGIVRLEFVAGEKAVAFIQKQEKLINELTTLLDCEKSQIPSRCAELFKKWKKARKGKLKEFVLESKEETSGDVVKEAASNLKTQPKHVLKTVKRFKEDIEKKLS